VNSATDEVPQILVQGILQYQDNPSLENFKGFRATIAKTTLRISMATMSQSYLKQLCQGKQPAETFDFWHSKSYDLREARDRREALRLIMGITRYLAAQK
jgi:hypothetical protein